MKRTIGWFVVRMVLVVLFAVFYADVVPVLRDLIGRAVTAPFYRDMPYDESQIRR